MKLLLTPQIKDVDFSFSGNGDVLHVTVDGETDTFDFMQMPDGRADTIESTLDPCPVLSAERVNGELTVTLLDWRPESARNMENEVIEL